MRRLALRKETLTELSTDDLSNVVGGYQVPTQVITNGWCMSGIVSCATLNDCVSLNGC